MRKNIPNLATCACGEGPITVLISAVKEMGVNCAEIISYANSGNTSLGDRTRVVGYGAVAFYSDEDCSSRKSSSAPSKNGEVFSLSGHQKKTLLAFARETIEGFLTCGVFPLARGFDPVLEGNAGAFVTLRKEGNLRGCIGHMDEDQLKSRIA